MSLCTVCEQFPGALLCYWYTFFFWCVCMCVWQSAELARAMSDISALTASATASIAKLQVTDRIFFFRIYLPYFYCYQYCVDYLK